MIMPLSVIEINVEWSGAKCFMVTLMWDSDSEYPFCCVLRRVRYGVTAPVFRWCGRNLKKWRRQRVTNGTILWKIHLNSYEVFVKHFAHLNETENKFLWHRFVRINSNLGQVVKWNSRTFPFVFWVRHRRWSITITLNLCLSFIASAAITSPFFHCQTVTHWKKFSRIYSSINHLTA